VPAILPLAGSKMDRPPPPEPTYKVTAEGYEILVES
jgi:hypothetical protein